MAHVVGVRARAVLEQELARLAVARQVLQVAELVDARPVNKRGNIKYVKTIVTDMISHTFGSVREAHVTPDDVRRVACFCFESQRVN